VKEDTQRAFFEFMRFRMIEDGRENLTVFDVLSDPSIKQGYWREFSVFLKGNNLQVTGHWNRVREIRLRQNQGSKETLLPDVIQQKPEPCFDLIKERLSDEHIKMFFPLADQWLVKQEFNLIPRRLFLEEDWFYLLISLMSLYSSFQIDAEYLGLSDLAADCRGASSYLRKRLAKILQTEDDLTQMFDINIEYKRRLAKFLSVDMQVRSMFHDHRSLWFQICLLKGEKSPFVCATLNDVLPKCIFNGADIRDLALDLQSFYYLLLTSKQEEFRKDETELDDIKEIRLDFEYAEFLVQRVYYWIFGTSLEIDISEFDQNSFFFVDKVQKEEPWHDFFMQVSWLYENLLIYNALQEENLNSNGREECA